MKTKTTIFFIILLVFSSCTAVKIPSERIYLDSNLTNNEGMILGCFSFDMTDNNSIKNSYDFYFKKIGQNDNYLNDKISLVPPQFAALTHKPDLIDGNNAIYYFGIKKEQGKYMFYALNTKVTVATGMGIGDMDELIKMETPFEIEKNKIKYLGEIKFIATKNYLKEKTFEWKYSFEFNNKSERDLKKLNELFPNLKIE